MLIFVCLIVFQAAEDDVAETELLEQEDATIAETEVECDKKCQKSLKSAAEKAAKEKMKVCLLSMYMYVMLISPCINIVVT